jgi:hypothetical protein
MGNLSMPKGMEFEELSSGGGSFLWETGIYDCVVDMVYFDKSKGGARSLNITVLNTEGKKLKQTLWVTNRKGEITYMNAKGEKRPLPGFSVATNLCVTAINEDLDSVDDSAEAKMVNVYDFTAKKEVPTEKSVATSLLGKKVKVAVFKQKVNKRVNDGTGNYVDSAETKEENEIKDFYFEDSGLTVAEKAKGITEAIVSVRWAERNTGNLIDRSKKVDASTAPAAASTNATGKKLF